jgi:L,D-transpeptidase YbiS
LVKGAPRGPYIVVDRGNNRLLLRSGGEILLDAVVSTGSGAVLHEPAPDGRTWQFATPAGRFRVLDERVDPVWVRPDWAFVEEGLPIPVRTADRRDPGALGEYALGLGDGYLIHGTLYERLLGYSVTHGCVRVGRDDLRALVRRVGPGTPVYIF